MKLKLHNRVCQVLSVLLILCTLVTLTQGFGFTVSAADTGEGTTKFDYLTQAYATAEEKWNSMQSKYTVVRGGYEMRIDPVSCEVAVRNLITGEINFSNPYSLASSSATQQVRAQMMSQVILTFKTSASGGVSTLYSYPAATQKGQFTIKQLKDGFSVSYTMGAIKKRSVVPRQIEATRFETMILDKIEDEEDKKDLLVWYGDVIDVNKPSMTKAEVALYQTTYKITSQINPETGKYYAIYVLDEIDAKNLAKLEAIVKSWAPDYTFEEVEYDHEFTDYVAQDGKQPLFKLTLEYYLDADGMYVSLPSNSIRFDETTYTLNSIVVLPYYGAGYTNFTGYGFVPDGSGTLVNFEDGKGRTAIIGGKNFGMVYGQDFSMHSSTVTNSEVVRMPVFGLVEHFNGKIGYKQGETVDETGKTVDVYDTAERDRGFFAIIEEGESLASVATEFTLASPYQTAYATFYPRPTDTYDLSASISAASSGSMYTIVAERKYTGNCTVRYFILNDEDLMAQKRYNGYESSYVGMAKLYREYLEDRGRLNRLTAADVASSIPLYIESFGAIDVQDTVLSIPVTKKLPLTTFDDLRAMYTDLETAGITNVNFRLTGFVNGGMDSTVPSEIKVEKKLGGADGYNGFVSYAKDKGFGVYLDFDFTEVKKTAAFDGFSSSRDALKTIDDRYIRSKMYDPVYQAYTYTGNILISVEAYDRLYSKFVKSMNEFDDHIGISVSTLGSVLNADYDEEDSYNRDDAQKLAEEMLARLDAVYGNVMIDAGNAYALPYATHILNVALDCSNFQDSSRSIPFVGMVLHGYVNFAGYATNTASDLNYETMKIIENGAAPYYMLSYRNTNKLKEDPLLSRYYAVSYEYGKDDMIVKYQELNSVMASLQTVLLDDHAFIVGKRVVNAADQEYDAAIGLTPEEIEAKYTVNNGKIVKVTYADGTYFYLNYNNFDVVINDTLTLGAMSYVKGE